MKMNKVCPPPTYVIGSSMRSLNNKYGMIHPPHTTLILCLLQGSSVFIQRIFCGCSMHLLRLFHVYSVTIRRAIIQVKFQTLS
jgi:hypothetical protein